jgi:predicted DNA-binding transcriptional regulator YafY
MQSIRLWRCLRLLNILQSQIGYSTSYLANEFDVSKRTIYRDLRFLEESGIPISYDIKKGGYVVLQPYSPSISKLSNDELTALLLASHIFSISCVREISQHVHQAISKLLAQMPNFFRKNMGNLLSSIRGIPSATLWPRGSQAVITEILSAISQKGQVRIVYEPAETATTPFHTKVTPNYLLVSEGHWYLIGRSSWHRKEYRFDLEHIRTVEQIANANSSESKETTYINVERLRWLSQDVQHDPLVTG